MAELRYAVHGVADSDGVPHSFVPGDTVPAWAAEQITNPKAWVDAPAPEVVPDEKPKPVRRSRKS